MMLRKDRPARRRRPQARPRRRATPLHAEGLEDRALMAQFVPGEVLVQYRPDAGDAARGRARGRAGAVPEESIRTGPMQDAGRGPLERVALPAGEAVPDAIRALQADPAVAYAEPNWIYTHEATSDDPYYTNGSLWGMYGDATSPADPYGSQAGEAWAAGQTGSRGVYVGVIDEGIQYTHPDLVNNAWTNPYDPPDGIDNDGNGYVDDVHGWDFVNNDNQIYAGGKRGQKDDHGTHVTGTIAAQGGNGLGVAGVDWNVTFISGKFLGANGGTTADAIKAVDYFTDLKARHGLNIVALNNSWGGGGFSQGLLDAITRAAQADILFIAAAGNNGSNNDASANYPSNYDTTRDGASYDSVIAVAALNSDGTLASYSDYGASTVDLAAPGSGIYSTVPVDGYASYSGTSMATPHVTGAAALYAAAHPGASAAQIKASLLGSAVPTASLAGRTATGGRLDVAAALNDTAPTTPPAAPSGLTASAVSSSQVNLAWADNSTDETGFQVEQSADGTTFAQVAVVPAGTTTYQVTGLAASTPYWFRVRASNAAGASAYCDPATVTTPAASTTTTHLFADDFSSAAINPAWAFYNGTWSQSAGVLSQTDTADAPEKKAIATGLSQTATQITAKVRVDSWQDGEYARAGVSLMTDPNPGSPTFGQGYSFVFTGRHLTGTNAVEFVSPSAWSGWDSEAGAAGVLNFPWTVGTWYWFQMKVEGNVLSGKVWKDGDPEPSGWMLAFDGNAYSGWTRTAGAAGLNGSSAGKFSRQRRSFATASFDDVAVDSTVAASGSAAPAGAAVAAAGGAAPGGEPGGLIVPLVPATVPALAGLPDDAPLGEPARDVARSRRRA